MAGQHTIQGASSVYSGYSNNGTSYTTGQLVSFNVPCKIVSMHFYMWSGTSLTINASIWDNTLTHGSSRLGGQNYTNSSVSQGSWVEVVFSTPVELQASKNYMIGWFRNGSASPVANMATASPYTGAINSSPSGVTATFGQAYFNSYVSEAWHPTTADSYNTPIMRLGIDTNVLPNAPTGLSVAGAVAPGGNPVASWTHNDPDSNPQSKYQIRWRRV